MIVLEPLCEDRGMLVENRFDGSKERRPIAGTRGLSALQSRRISFISGVGVMEEWEGGGCLPASLVAP
jgi:hypothetical protein